MFRFPFYGYPYNYNYYRYYNQITQNNISNLKGPHESDETLLKDKENKNETFIENKEEKSSITNSRNISNTTDKPIFEILGIKLYLDDLIIIGVMYFLYQQNVHDEMLYLILFMLLFS